MANDSACPKYDNFYPLAPYAVVVSGSLCLDSRTTPQIVIASRAKRGEPLLNPLMDSLHAHPAPSLRGASVASDEAISLFEIVKEIASSHCVRLAMTILRRTTQVAQNPSHSVIARSGRSPRRSNLSMMIVDSNIRDCFVFCFAKDEAMTILRRTTRVAQNPSHSVIARRERSEQRSNLTIMIVDSKLEIASSFASQKTRNDELGQILCELRSLTKITKGIT